MPGGAWKSHGAAPDLAPLIEGIAARPGVTEVDAGHVDQHGLWSIGFAIDTTDPDAWEEIRRFAWLFNNQYGPAADGISFRPVVLEEPGAEGRRPLWWLLEALESDYGPERALDVLLTPLAPFEPPL